MRVGAVGLGAVLAAVVAAAPFVYWSRESVRYRNLRVVRDGVLLRSGQMTPDGFRRAVREHGVGTVVSLRDRVDEESGVHQDQAEADYCAANGVAFHRLPPGDWSPVDGVVPGERTVREFVRVMGDPTTRKPVLVHCFAGIHRTGAHCAVYRMEFEGWSTADAIAEMRSMGTPRTTFADNLLAYLNGYERGKFRTGAKNLTPPPPSLKGKGELEPEAPSVGPNS